MPTVGDNRFDVIPADIVSNSIIIVTANSAIKNIPFEVYNCGSSVQNPTTIRQYATDATINLGKYKFKDKVKPVGVVMEPNPTLYELRKNLTERWPVDLLAKALDLPFVNNPQLKKQVKTLQKI